MAFPVQFPVNQTQLYSATFTTALYGVDQKAKQSCTRTISDDAEISFITLQGKIISEENDNNKSTSF